MKKERLNKQVVRNMNQSTVETDMPVKIIQIGDGNFIRAFIDWLIDGLNKQTDFNGKVALVQALPNDQTIPKLEQQDWLYTVVLQGRENNRVINDRYVIEAIDRGINPYTEWEELLELVKEKQVECLFSNTTEAGIQYMKESYRVGHSPISFPGKVTALLYQRYLHFNGERDKGWVIVPCELIENNGDRLKEICLKIASDWELPAAFEKWIQESCAFCNTLVDRIVPGFPKEQENPVFNELEYDDQLLAVAEPYHLFVIEGPDDVKERLPFHQTKLHVQFDEIQPYRELKVKLLNAPHTILATLGLFKGVNNVKESMESKELFRFIDHVLKDEIVPTLRDSEQKMAGSYINQVYNRFLNPYLDHQLASIRLNHYSKFITRVWPTIYNYIEKYQTAPKRLSFAFAVFILFYQGRDHQVQYEIQDDQAILERFHSFYARFDGSKPQLHSFVKELIKQDFLSYSNDVHIEALCHLIVDYFFLIKDKGIECALKEIEKESHK